MLQIHRHKKEDYISHQCAGKSMLFQNYVEKFYMSYYDVPYEKKNSWSIHFIVIELKHSAYSGTVVGYYGALVENQSTGVKPASIPQQISYVLPWD